jgi:hypothetical protein
VTVLSSGEDNPGPVAVTGGYVYWVNGDGSARRTPSGGGAHTTVSTGCGLVALAVDATRVYCGGTGQTILAAPITGGSTVTLATSQPAADLAVSGGHLYWTTYYGERIAGGNAIDAVGAIPTSGGAIAFLATKQLLPSSIAVDSANAYWLDSTVDDKGTVPAHGVTVMSVPLDGGTPRSIATSAAGSVDSGGGRNKTIALTTTRVYWSTNDGGEILSVPLAGGSVSTFAAGETFPGSLAADDAHVYWATTSAIRKAAVSGGPAVDLVTGQQAASIAIDATHVYWTDSAKGTVNRAAR